MAADGERLQLLRALAGAIRQNAAACNDQELNY